MLRPINSGWPCIAPYGSRATALEQRLAPDHATSIASVVGLAQGDS